MNSPKLGLLLLTGALSMFSLTAIAGCGGNPEVVSSDAQGTGGLAEGGTGGTGVSGGPEINVGGGGSDAGGTGGGSGVVPTCGNRAMDDGEECDDGNADSGDGCDAQCQLEAGFSCPVPGSACEECG